MIKQNFIYNYPILEKVTNADGNRYYVDPAGNKLSSVTTILSKTGDKTGLTEWANRVGEQEANRIKSEAAGLGSLMHTHLENFIMEVPRPSGNNVVRKMASEMADQIIHHGLVKVQEVWGIEKMLYFPELYAGTSDLIGVHEGRPAIMDYKTSKKIKKEEYIQDYFLQGAAYALAHNKVYGTDINKIVIFMVSRDLKFKEFVVEGNLFKNYCNEWIKRLEEFYQS